MTSLYRSRWTTSPHTSVRVRPASRLSDSLIATGGQAVISVQLFSLELSLELIRMPPKKSIRQARKKAPSADKSPPASSPTSLDLSGNNGFDVPAKKRATAADNAKAITALQADMSSITGLLTQISQKLCGPAEPPQPVYISEADPENYAPPTRGRLQERHTDPHCTFSAPSPARETVRDRHVSITDTYKPVKKEIISSDTFPRFLHHMCLSDNTILTRCPVELAADSQIDNVFLLPVQIPFTCGLV